MDPMEAIKATFFVECEEQLAELEAGLMAMEAGTHDAETVNAVFRAVHSVKGGAGAFSLDELVRYAHVFETTLDALRAGRLPSAPATLQIMLRAADGLADLVRVARDGGSADAARIAALAAELAALINPGGAAAGAAASLPGGDIDDFDFEPVSIAVAEPAPAARSWKIRFKPQAELYAKGNEAGLLLRELGRLGAMDVQLDSGNLPDLTELDPEGAYLTWNIILTADCEESAIRDVFDFVEDECELEIVDAAPAAAAPAAANPTAAGTPLVPQANAATPNAGLPPPPPAAPTPQQAAAAQAAAAPAAAAPATPQVIEATGDTWIQVADTKGNILFSKTMHQGDTWPVPNLPGLVLTAGNAGATVIDVNGQPGTPLGSTGTVLRNFALTAPDTLPVVITPSPSGPARTN